MSNNSYAFIKYRIYPNETQKKQIREVIGACRWVWNWALDKCTRAYAEQGIHLNGFDIVRDLTKLRNSEGMEWLKKINRFPLSQTLRELNFAFEEFYHKRNNYPKFKDLNLIKKRADGFYRTEFNRVEGDSTHFNIERLGMIRTKIHKPLPEKERNQRSVKIICDIRGRYYAIVAYRLKKIEKREIKTKVGIDLGIKPLVTLSNGTKYFMPKNLFDSKYKKHLAHHQRVLSRKASGSMNYEKQRIKVARIIEKEVNRRNHYFHNITKALVMEYDEIHKETIPLEEMYQTKFGRLKRALYQTSMFTMSTQLERKANLYGVTLYSAERDFPSTQLCSNCGFRNKAASRLGVKKWKCPECGAEHDRDVNAAINLLNHYPYYSK